MQKSLVKRQFKRVLLQYGNSLKIRSIGKLDNYIQNRFIEYGLCYKVNAYMNSNVYKDIIFIAMNQFPYRLKYYTEYDTYCSTPLTYLRSYLGTNWIKLIKRETIVPRIKLLKYIIKNFDDLWKEAE